MAAVHDAQEAQPELRRGKRWGLVFLIPPVGVVTLFAVAETIGREPGWWGHFLQLAVVVGIAALAWARPRLGGPLLILTAVAAAGAILPRADAGMAVLPAIVLVCLPLMLAGVLFTLAGIERTDRHPQ